MSTVAQEKQNGLILGLNHSTPHARASLYDGLMGFQLGYFSRSTTDRTFNFEKSIMLTTTRMEDFSRSNQLLFKSTTLAISVPLIWHYNRIKGVQPFIGTELIWRFHTKTNYRQNAVVAKEPSTWQVAYMAGIKVPVSKQFALDMRYALTPYFLAIGNSDLFCFQFSVRYNLRE